MAQQAISGLSRLTVEVYRSHTHTHTHTHTGRTPLNEWSARRRDHYLHNTQQTQETNIHVFSGIRTRDSRNRSAADLRLWPHKYRDRPIWYDVVLLFSWLCCPTRAMASSFTRFLDHTQRRATVGRTPLEEWSARRRDLYLTTHNTHNRQTSMPPVGFGPMISTCERPRTTP
jgi:hypothetical protein